MSTFYDYIRTSYSFNQKDYDTIKEWKLLETLYEKNWNTKDTTHKIPKKIHQIWLGGIIPLQYAEWGESFKELHPDWEYKLWTDLDIDNIPEINKNIWNNLRFVGAKSDYLRYILLNKYGGFYFDTDFRCLKSLEPLLKFTFVTGVGYLNKPELYNGFIASIPDNAIMKALIKYIEGYKHPLTIKDVFSVTGPYRFTGTFFSIVNSYREGVLVLPPPYIYPFPNSKGFMNRNGDSYIVPESFVIHYWEVSWMPYKPNYIQGERFIGVADFIYTPRYKSPDDYLQLQNTFIPINLKSVNIVYTHTYYVKQLFAILKYLKEKFVIITHNSDINIDKSFIVPNNVIKWFAQNVNVQNPKIESIPIGLENTYWFKQFGDKRVFMKQTTATIKNISNLAYLNCSERTNPTRKKVVEYFKGASYVTYVKGANGINTLDYFHNLYNHKFMICPDGNGIDTVRLWESLYMKTFPIVKRSINTEFYNDLPICYVDNWEDVTEEFLNKEYDRLSKGIWNFDKLNFKYWINKINSYRHD